MSHPPGGPPVSDGEFTKIQELLYELAVAEVMTPRPVTARASDPMESAKALMRTHRISGIPIADGPDLVGILSVEDVIRWLEAGGEAACIEAWMTRPVHTVHADEAAIQAVTKFGRTRVGRLPVLDEAGVLVGIVTPGDIIGRVLRVLDRRYRVDERRVQDQPLELQEALSEGGVMRVHYQVAARDFERAGAAATGIKRLLGRLGVDAAVTRRVSIAAYEAEMNLAIHTDRGGQLIAEIRPDEISLEAIDEGPGIPDLDRAMTEGFSTAPDWVRALGFGAGMGLNNMKRCGDGFSIRSSPGEGTVVRVSFNLPSLTESAPGIPFSAPLSAQGR
jgi:CBS domain-containing protein/anti-sigma regulatory factor (Ser/Thr protein kinase)